ncbi:MAG: hypothetical protein M0P73_12075 [Syntrophobacterales bacterium]|jgi:hypothetical protein|nr:hypothetical protein [Syntrophobacterales bacterium]
MTGKVKVLFLVLTAMFMATAAPAYAALFPINSGWSASYNAGDSADQPNLWSSLMKASGEPTLIDGTAFYYVYQSNWESPGAINQFWLGSTDTALFRSTDGLAIDRTVFETGEVGHSWSYTKPDGTTTSTIMSPTWGYTVSDSYHQDAYLVKSVTALSDGNYSPPWYEVWLSGVGLLGDLDYWTDNAPVYHQLVGYQVDPPAVPVPPSLALLASGLVCLVGWRKRSLFR